MKKLIPVVAIVLAASVAFSQMQQGKDGKRPGKGKMPGRCIAMKGMAGPGCTFMGMMMLDGERIAKRLGLSDQEKAGVKEITDKLKTDLHGIGGKIVDAHKALHDEYLKKDLDNGAIDTLNRKIIELHTAKMEMMANARKALMNKLTAEQRAKLMPPMECPMKGKRPGKARRRKR
ncbi:MAG: Spy/CpxP family protein refolding chaperone [Spirochaetes bacterium]|nr:Spy/CpxP family protein refolding chaperone [Spirochaetota bacterium]